MKDNTDALLKASNFGSQRYDAFSKTDVESISGYFDYFAGWSRETTRNLGTDQSEETGEFVFHFHTFTRGLYPRC